MTTKDFESIYQRAWEAGVKAANACTPRPMVVQEHSDPLNDASPVVRTYPPVMDGLCGFAWVNVRPGTSAFCRWLVATGKGRKDYYYGGVTIWISNYNQSYERKMAHANAMVKALRDEGFKRAYAFGRLD